MTIQEVYQLLCSRNYYELSSATRFRFEGNNMFVDRRAGVPFTLHEESGNIYLDTASPVSAGENLLRIETDHPDGNSFHFYGKNSGRELLILH